MPTDATPERTPQDDTTPTPATMPHPNEWAAAREAFDAVTTLSLAYQRMPEVGRRAIDALGNLLAVYDGYGEE